ncbi:uncharacterized protein AMSG_11083 [Thecamonas trahens ATCC 50062]|uniref:Uncharacterized protein n=1 Tax=Thecamonas trahens ATCC 50062 TaxID=461836 RepID=A0A0L0DTN3_THETB|nr:hypothetical protein AMSG_11083 [Thecamonas trahens ATCC 50062]KNC55421.1 hypothetical protein AMSG_11083 [Thecamonas trahens ATCC 50062]|eukprot:XP_013752960.1 hypothetical protein AMSG_11083 [Thecamonas trahens ATCC 50062]
MSTHSESTQPASATGTTTRTTTESYESYEPSDSDLSRQEMREHLSRIAINDVATQAVEIRRLKMSASKWISLILLAIRFLLNVSAVISNFYDQVFRNKGTESGAQSSSVSLSRTISVYAELGIMSALFVAFIVLVVDLVYSLFKVADQAAESESEDARFEALGGVEVVAGKVVQEKADFKDRAGSAAKNLVTTTSLIASMSLLQFMPSLQKLKDLPRQARAVSRYVAKKLRRGEPNPLVRRRRWTELSTVEATVLFMLFGFLQAILFIIALAALFVKLSQLQFTVEREVIDWSFSQILAYAGFLNNVASIVNVPHERLIGVLRVVFAGADGRLDNIEWNSLETFRSFFAYRVIMTHNLWYGFMLLTQLSARDLQTVLIAERETEVVDESKVEELNAFEAGQRINVFSSVASQHRHGSSRRRGSGSNKARKTRKRKRSGRFGAAPRLRMSTTRTSRWTSRQPDTTSSPTATSPARVTSGRARKRRRRRRRRRRSRPSKTSLDGNQQMQAKAVAVRDGLSASASSPFRARTAAEDP